MDFEKYRVEDPTRDQYCQIFTENLVRGKRYLLTFVEGNHLVGVPLAYSYSDESFKVRTPTRSYDKVPFDVLAYAEELTATPGLRPSDGTAPVPEPCSAPICRKKEQKFGILDAHGMLAADLKEDPGYYGFSLLYFDIDHFHKLNSEYSEIQIDKTVLPELQRLVDKITRDHGFAYREGGDEFIILLRNCSMSIALPFAEFLRVEVEQYQFMISEGQPVNITVSIGLAASADATVIPSLPAQANAAKQIAKENGRNQIRRA